jgi:predicted HTH domain antitoxin
MKTLTLTVPDSLDLSAQEAAMLLAAHLYEQGKLTLGQAAEVAGYSKRTFMELLGQYGVSVINHSPDDLARDVANA